MTWQWAEKGISGIYDRAIAAVLLTMNTTGGLAILRKAGWHLPPVTLLLGTSVMTAASQLVEQG